MTGEPRVLLDKPGRGDAPPVPVGQPSREDGSWVPRQSRRRARLVVWLAAAGFLAALAAGHDIQDRLTTSGASVIGAESAEAERLARTGFRAGDPDVILIARGDGPVDGARAASTGTRLASELAASPGVSHVTSYWATRDGTLRSEDGRGAMILAWLEGGTGDRIDHARRIVPGLVGAQGPLDVTATGSAQVEAEVEDRSEADLRRAELIAAPLTLAIGVVVFGGLVAAALPVLVGALAVAGTMAVLRLLTQVTDVSVFAMSIATALGFALAVDFSLFVVTRFREELAAGRDPSGAVGVTMRTTGKAMAFSAATVSLSLLALLLFPLTLLRSIAYGGIIVTVMAALGSLIVLPAVLVLLGRRINGLRVPGRSPGRRKDPEKGAWYRIAMAVMRRPLGVAIPTALVLAVLGAPFLGVRFGASDERMLPPDAPSVQATEQLRRDFGAAGGPLFDTPVVVPGLRVAPGGPDAAAAHLDAYARRVSSLDGVVGVETATGSYTRGSLAAPAGERSVRFTGPVGTWLAVKAAPEADSVDNSELAERIRALPPPGGAPTGEASAGAASASGAGAARVLVGGPGAELADVRQSIADRLPLALGLIALTTFLLVTVLAGGVLLGLKALAMNVLSLCATFGVLVHIFQEGHLRWLVGDFTVTGSIDAQIPALLFCVAFGLSMDYEIFLLARIAEEHRRTGDTVTAVASGLAHTGRLFTSAALIFAVVMAALATSGLTLLKLLGVGLALAVLLDATLVRALLVPAVMRLAGRANWWTPRIRPRRD